MAVLSITPAVIDSGILPTGLPKTYDNIINLYGNKYKVDSKVIKKIIALESSYNPNEITGSALGLMQVMSFHLPRLNLTKTEALQPSLNINAGTRIFREMYNQVYNWKTSNNPTTNLYLALAAYNGGPTRLRGLINKYGLAKALGYMPRESQDYVLKYKNLDKILKGVRVSTLRNQPITLAGFELPPLTLPELTWRGISTEIKTLRPEWSTEDVQAISEMPVLMVEEKKGMSNYMIYAGIGLGILMALSLIKKGGKVK